MRLTDYIIDLGRAVAFYPKFTEKITESTTATLLLCQLLYWTDKTTDGWIYKTHYELTEETGLTYNEQKTARRKLKKLGILQEQRRRLERTTRYRIDQNALNDLWEDITGKSDKEIEEEPKQLSFEDTPIMPYKDEKEKKPKRKYRMEDDPNIPEGYKGSPLQFYKDLPVESEEKKNEIRGKLSMKLLIGNIDSPRWDKFIEYAYKRQEEDGQDIDTFISYMLTEQPERKYWGGATKIVENFIMWYPLAFVKKKEIENFVNEPEHVEETVLEEMPDFVKDRIKNKNKLF